MRSLTSFFHPSTTIFVCVFFWVDRDIGDEQYVFANTCMHNLISIAKKKKNNAKPSSIWAIIGAFKCKAKITVYRFPKFKHTQKMRTHTKKHIMLSKLENSVRRERMFLISHWIWRYFQSLTPIPIENSTFFCTQNIVWMVSHFYVCINRRPNWYCLSFNMKLIANRFSSVCHGAFTVG